MTDQTIAEEAVEAAAWVLAGADRHADIGTAWIDCARRVLAAAYPYLRQQWEAEIASEIGAIKERQVDAYVQHRVNHRDGDVDGEQIVTWNEAAAHAWDVLYPALSDVLARDAASDGWCSCDDGRPWPDCGIRAHREAARGAAQPGGE